MSFNVNDPNSKDEASKRDSLSPLNAAPKKRIFNNLKKEILKI
jgi:hypothetical protein